MWPSRSHLSDQELLLFVDREASPRGANKAQKHLDQCPSCRARITRLEATLRDFAQFHQDHLQSATLVQSEPVPSPALRAAFQAKLSEAASRSRTPQGFFSERWPRQLASAAIALLIVAGVTWAGRNMLRQRAGSNELTLLAGALPRRQLTPGAVRDVQLRDLCADQDLDNDPPVDPSVAKAVFREYGLPEAAKSAYALDYLITPALGGARDIQNLWPQPDSATWNASVKDQLENQLHRMVCQGTIPLSTAQNEIAADWISAYKRHFHTDAPLSNAASLAPPTDDRAARLLTGSPALAAFL